MKRKTIIWLICTGIVLMSVIMAYFVVNQVPNKKDIYIYNVDTLKTPIILTRKFKDLKLYKIKDNKEHLLYNNDGIDTTELIGHRGIPYESPYIEENYDSLPDTIFASGYYVKYISELREMLEFRGEQIRIMSYRYRK